LRKEKELARGKGFYLTIHNFIVTVSRNKLFQFCWIAKQIKMIIGIKEEGETAPKVNAYAAGFNMAAINADSHDLKTRIDKFKKA
jgi:hypothetical protein